MALANMGIDFSPQNPTTDDSIDIEVTLIVTYIDPDFRVCARVGYEADIIVAGNVERSVNGFTKCEGDDADIINLTVSLPAGDHEVRVEGTVDGIEGELSVSDTADGTISVESPFEPSDVFVEQGSCSVEPVEVAPGESVTVGAFVINQNDSAVSADVVWEDQSGKVRARTTVDVIAATGGRRAETTFEPQQDLDLEPRVVTRSVSPLSQTAAASSGAGPMPAFPATR